MYQPGDEIILSHGCTKPLCKNTHVRTKLTAQDDLDDNKEITLSNFLTFRVQTQRIFIFQCEGLVLFGLKGSESKLLVTLDGVVQSHDAYC